MPMPYTYRHASAEWRAFLDDAKEAMNLVSDNSTYTAIEGVFLTFRRRLTVEQGLAFADLLPAVPRAIFVANWRPAAPLPFTPRDVLTAEAQGLRPHHNLTPANCIEAVARALLAQVAALDLAQVLADFPAEARAFWAVPDPQPGLRFP
jgi:uncharacterized protein (DUF2267 family)